jgi:glycosyltransferase involved in cell wall biosynthesis
MKNKGNMENEREKTPLIIHTDWSRAWGGQEIRVLTELRAMRNLGFATGLIVPADSELAIRCADEGFSVYPVSFSSKFYPSCWLEVTRLIRKLRPTVINTHSSEDSWIAGCVARLCKVPLIIRTRHVSAPISSACTYNLFAHIVFTCSASIADQLVSQGVHQDKLVILPTGIAEERFKFSQAKRDAIRAAYGIGKEEIVVGNVAFLRHYKGHPFILKTAAQMPVHYRFLLVGDGGERSSLERLAQELGIRDRVIFAGHQENPEAFFNAMDLCFFSSYEAEGVAQSLVQGLLNGLPVLACRIPSTEEVLKKIAAYQLVDYGDIPAACKGIFRLASSPGRDLHQAEQQWQTIAEQYGLRHMIKILLNTYARFDIFPPEVSQL